jgi:hypothetical protein
VEVQEGDSYRRVEVITGQRRQNLANPNTAKSPINVAVQGVACSSRMTNPA